MCGITGFLSAKGLSHHEMWDTVVRMSQTLYLRGPDDGGAWVDSDAGVALGHRRLSVLDLTESGHQPMTSPCGRYVLVFNGEIYNFKSIRAELEGDGQRFRSDSDTEVMLAAVVHWGVETAVKRFNGMFAFGLWDRQERLLWLGRDRVGEKPIYYGWCGRTFMFGSSLRALREHPDFTGHLAPAPIALYLRFAYVPAPYSVYQGMMKLPPGTLLRVDPLRIGDYPQPTPYWSMRTVAEYGTSNRFTDSPEELVERLDQLLRDSVRLRMVSDVPVGVFLSGGVDSSTVAALMQAQSGQPIRTFTIGFHEKSYNEAEDARKVSSYLGTNHTELYVTPREALEVVPMLPVIYDEPFSDASQIPTYLLCKLARQSVTVALSGDAGDELFGGYNRYLWGSAIWRRVGWVPAGLRRLAGKALSVVPPRAWDAVFATTSPLIPARLRHPNPGDKLHKMAKVLAADSPGEVYAGLVSQWEQPEAVVVGSSALDTFLSERGQWAELDELASQMMFLDLCTYLPGDILTKVDGASMGVSLEARVPLLDPKVVEFAWRTPLDLKIRDGKGKWILRQVLGKYIPSEMVERPKMGFGVPIDRWLRGPLREWGDSLLSEHKLQEHGVFNPEPIRKRWAEHQAGKRNWEQSLWAVLMFQAWIDTVHKPTTVGTGTRSSLPNIVPGGKRSQ